MPTSSNRVHAIPLSSRPDTQTEEIIDTAVRMVMEVGLTAAEEYLHRKGVNRRTSLRVLSYNAQTRRKSP